VFSGAFSTNRLYHAIAVWNISCSRTTQTHHNLAWTLWRRSPRHD